MHNSIYEGFIKVAAAQGIDAELLSNCLTEADELYAATVEVVKEAEEQFGNSNFKAPLIKALVKDAGIWDDLTGNFSKLTGMHQQMASSVLGAGGGGLAGLMLSKTLGIENPGIAMLLASLLGGYAGHSSYGSSPQPVAKPAESITPTPPQVGNAAAAGNAVGSAMGGMLPLGAAAAGAMSSKGMDNFNATQFSPHLRQPLTSEGMANIAKQRYDQGQMDQLAKDNPWFRNQLQPLGEVASATWDQGKYPMLGTLALSGAALAARKPFGKTIVKGLQRHFSNFTKATGQQITGLGHYMRP